MSPAINITRKLSRDIFRILLDNSNNCCMRRSQFSAVVVLPDWYLPILSSNFKICDSFVSFYLCENKTVLSKWATPCKRSLFGLFEWEGEQGGSAWILSSLWIRPCLDFWTCQSCSLWSNLFSECEHPFVDNPVVTEPAGPSARLLGLGSKRYPSNKQLLAQKRSYLIHAYSSLSLVRKNRDQVKERLC